MTADLPPATLDPSPVDDLTPPDETPRKRGPGRPRGSKNRTTTDRAPRKAGTRSTAAATAVRSMTTKLGQLFTTAGGLIAVKDPYCGRVIMDGAPALAKAIANVAKDKPALARALGQVASVGAYGELVAAVAAIAIPIGAHHGLVPPQVVQAFAAGADVPPPPDAGVPADEVTARMREAYPPSAVYG